MRTLKIAVNAILKKSSIYSSDLASTITGILFFADFNKKFNSSEPYSEQ